MVLTKPKRRQEQELQDYWIKDLARYGIQVHLINKHSELEAILREISFKSGPVDKGSKYVRSMVE